uniref:hypothetical protein n=3 Tax=Vibrio harveyi TaxID=669 RepID=UPI001E329A51
FLLIIFIIGNKMKKLLFIISSLLISNANATNIPLKYTLEKSWHGPFTINSVAYFNDDGIAVTLILNEKLNTNCNAANQNNMVTYKWNSKNSKELKDSMRDYALSAFNNKNKVMLLIGSRCTLHGSQFSGIQLLPK